MKRSHTKRDLVRMFKQRQLRAKRLLGQNFLIDHNILNYICNAGELAPSDIVLEIGAGTGLLTEHLARSGAEVVAVEIDRNLFDIAHQYVGQEPNVRILCCDIHGKRHRINPEVEAALEQAIAPERPLKVIGNLPYCISTDLVVSLIEMQWSVERMVLTVQEEFADRMLAAPGSRCYGLLTVLLGARADVERLKDLPPSVFWPVPRVGSAIVRVRPVPERLEQITDYTRFKYLAKVLFSQRRTTAARALKGMIRPRLSKQQIMSALCSAGMNERVRADRLSPAQTVALSNQLP